MLVHVLREYYVNRILLSCIGCWPFQSELVKRFLPLFFLVLEISYLPIQIFTLYKNRNDGRIIFESSYQMIAVFAFLLKLLNQLWNRDKFRRLYEVMEDHWNTFSSDQETQILKEYSSIAYKCTMIYAIAIYSLTWSFITIPVVMPTLLDTLLPLNESRPRQFLLYAEFGVDRDKYFMPIFSYTVIAIVSGISIMVAADTIHMACTAHACSLFQLIGHQIENITSRVKAMDKVNVSSSSSSSCNAIMKLESFQEQLIHQEYIVCLKKHQLAIEFVDILNDTHRVVAFYYCLLIAVGISLVGVRIVYMLDQFEEIITYVFILMARFMQLMIMCYCGQKLMDESENIFHRAYAAEWYRFSPRLKSLLIIALYRSIVPCKLTALNLFPLSMAVSAAVVRTSMSYFTAFLSLKE